MESNMYNLALQKGRKMTSDDRGRLDALSRLVGGKPRSLRTNMEDGQGNNGAIRRGNIFEDTDEGEELEQEDDC